MTSHTISRHLIIHKNGVILEYMQYRDLDHWFGQPNPPGFRHEELAD